MILKIKIHIEKIYNKKSSTKMEYVKYMRHKVGQDAANLNRIVV
jgi:hypothetical protein